ncbi:MAG: SurA N-terminal domain-containing protein, partial [Gemmatimonadota bacterium]
MRDSAKWVMLILALAFVGWLVFDWVQSRGGDLGSQANPVVATIGGTEIQYDDWSVFLENRLALARQQGVSLTEEESRVVTEEAWEDLVSATILQSEIERLGLQVSDEEVRQAFLTRPPPEFLSHPAFQTDGRFDLAKYRRFFSDPSMDEQTLLEIEGYYRSILPRTKLRALISEAVYVSEDEAWRFFRDTNEQATVRYVRVDPAVMVPDSAVSVTDAEIRAHYDRHRDDFRRPASARVNMLSLTLQPSQADSAAARARADSLRQRILGGEAFEEIARAESADSVSGRQGGDVGKRARADLQPALAEAAYAVPVGEVSAPVQTPFGFHLLRVEERSDDSVSLRQIFVPIRVSPATEDSVFSLIDALEGIALQSDLVTAADSLGVPVRRDVVLTEDSDFVPGAGALGVAADWAIDEPEVELGELSPFFENATGFHVIELLERREAGF